MKDTTETAKSSPYFSIVIPAYNEEEHIGSCLQAIFNADYDSSQYEVIVVDNGSQDKTYETAVKFGRAKVFQLLEGNVGAVRNYGAKKARGEMLVFLDADCLIDNGWLNRAENLITDYPNCAYGGSAKLPCNATWVETSWLLETKGQPTLPKHLIGASTMLSKELFLKLNGFDELVSSGEDTDLHRRLASKNIHIFISNALDITHLGNAKTCTQFIKRQIWHSENYLTNLKTSLKDPVFLITLAFIFSFFTFTFQNLFLSSKSIFFISLSSCAILPAILSWKRMYRSGYFTFMPNILVKIYALDLLYLIGRSIGLLKGVR
ncbi:glycosyltransferase [Marinobacter salexigens]|uniref:glycosyltransferase n=1 Tax=Marinobacter salexigens TaxID=1925763 RepID=UPI000C28974F|nr:glycosyltransferase family A protein [Marinobacter salexigens]